MEEFLAQLELEVEHVHEEVFVVFSQQLPSHDLGMVDARAHLLELSIAGRDFEVNQSPGILQSARGGGTTGAALWETSVRVAEWLAWPTNPLYQHGILDAHSHVLELGAGISGLVACVLSQKVAKFAVTDQPYVLKAVRRNIEQNSRLSTASRKQNRGSSERQGSSNIDIFPLDWESDNVESALTANGLSQGVDLLLAIDCVYNYALVTPFVQTCAEICSLRQCQRQGDKRKLRPTICIVAQQLRQPEVFEEWLRAFHARFQVWRLADSMLITGLTENSGFVVHVGILRKA